METSNVKTHNGAGIAALVLGIIGIVICWFPLFPIFLGALAVIFGALGYWKMEPHDGFGLAGFILGILTIIFGFIFLIGWSTV